VFLFSCENSEKEINALNKKSLMKDEATFVESYLSQGGKVKAKLTAPVLVRLQADTVYTEFPKTLHVDFYNDNKIVDTRLDSRYGKYYETLNKIYLRDSVRVVTTKGDTLYCKDLWWDQNKQLFYTDKIAIYRSHTQKLEGQYGLEATQDLKTITFKNTSGQIQTAAGQIPGN
jgi:LPS export ABC transporter protein LptC